MELKFEVIEQLQDLDLKIQTLMGSRETGPKEVSTVEKALKGRELSVAVEREKFSKYQSELTKKKQAYDDEVEQIKRKQERVPELKNQKEYQASLREIEASRMEMGILEEDLKVAQERIKVQEAKLTEVEDELKKHQASAAEKKNQVDQQLASLDQDLKKLREERKVLEGQLPSDVFRQYDGIRKRAKGKIIFRINQPACPQCFMSIAPQRFYELRTAPKLFACESCHSLLYWCKE